MIRLLLDTRPLREVPAFRRLWIGTTLSSIGSALTIFALPLEVYDLTRSTFDVGIVSAAQLVPALSIGLAGGALADRMRRRTLAIVTSVGLAVVSLLLAVQADARIDALWLLYVLAAAQAGLGALSQPVRRAVIPALLPPDQLRAGLSLNRLSFQIMLISGPALAGLITAVPALGLRGCYAIDAVSYGASLYGVLGLPDVLTGAAPQRTVRAVVEGLRFVRRSQRLLGALLADLDATVFALPVALFPAINAQRFGGDPRTLGLFAAAIGVGGLVSAALSGPLNHIARPGVAMIIAVAIWGGAFAAFAVVSGLALTLITLAIAGAVDTVTVVLRGAVVQANVPDRLRGRITAVEYVVGVGGGQLGNLEAGALGSVTSPATAALIGGLVTVAGAIALATALPQFVRHRHGEAAPGAPT